MKRFLRLTLISSLAIIIMGQAAYGAKTEITQNDINEGIAFCKDYPVSLQVDGNTVEADVPPVIIKERTLIPARVVFESMGATVNWDEEAGLVDVSLGTSNVKLTINSYTAFVNGGAVPLEVPPMIIDNRTLIPVRFVAQSLSCGVDWDGLSRTVKLTSPEIIEKTTINSIELSEKEDYYRIILQGTGVFAGYKSFAYENPERFGIDIKNASLYTDGSSIDSDNDNNIFNKVRFSQFDSNTVRIVVDLDEKVAGKISYSSEKDCIFIDFDKSQLQVYEGLGDVTKYGLDIVDWKATGKLVVIDPGHGGRDSGTQGFLNGTTVNEKDINLDVAIRLNEMLKEAGVSTYILRETDTSIELPDRPTLANAANGALYVSIHNNSAESSSIRGVEVYYNSKSNEKDYGIFSKHLAELAHDNLVNTIATNGRGAKSGPGYAVLNKTNMPAIIIEGSFLSSPDDLKMMMTDEFRHNYALAAAKAIVQVLNESVAEE